MSVLAVLASPVVQALQATPTPIVVHDTVQVVKTVPAVSPELMKAAQLLLLFLTTVGVSLLHQFVKRDKWSAGLNRFLWLVYATIISVVAAYVTGQLSLTVDSAVAFATDFLIALGSGQGVYTLANFYASKSDSVASATDVQSDEQVIPTLTADV
jgi:hypothetical protein